MSNTSLLLPDPIRRRLDALMLSASTIRAGAIKGERRSVKRGTSIEFADYRNYTPGDDLRKLDWNVYARLDKPYIKLLEDEEDLAVHILIDTSASMDWQPDEKPDENKLLYARRVAAGLAYIALMHNDRLTLHAFTDSPASPFGPARGRAQIVPMLRFAHRLEAGGVTDFNAAARAFTVREKRPGLVFILSDLFTPNGTTEGLNRLLERGHEVVVLHLLTSDEIAPVLVGDLRLIDVETHAPQEVTIDSTLRALYQQRLDAWLDGLRADCGKRGVHYLMTSTDIPFEKIILYELRRLGVVK